MSEAHKPVITAELLIMLAFVEAKRLKQGNAIWCRKYFVGKARRLLAKAPDGNVITMSPEAEPHFAPQRDAQMALKALCVRCGKCPMALE